MTGDKNKMSTAKYRRKIDEYYQDALKRITELEQKNREKDSIIADLRDLKSRQYTLIKKINDIRQQKTELVEFIRFLKYNVGLDEDMENRIDDILSKYKETLE